MLLDGLQQADCSAWMRAAGRAPLRWRCGAAASRPGSNCPGSQAASGMAADPCGCGCGCGCDCGSDSDITVAEFGALAGLTCHAPATAEGQAARYALLQASSEAVAAAAAPCLEHMAHLPDPPLPPRLAMPRGAIWKRSSGRAR